MRTTSFQIPDDLYRKVNLAAASVGLSSSEYIRLALKTALADHAEHDPIVRFALDTDTRIRESVTA